VKGADATSTVEDSTTPTTEAAAEAAALRIAEQQTVCRTQQVLIIISLRECLEHSPHFRWNPNATPASSGTTLPQSALFFSASAAAAAAPTLPQPPLALRSFIDTLIARLIQCLPAIGINRVAIAHQQRRSNNPAAVPASPLSTGTRVLSQSLRLLLWFADRFPNQFVPHFPPLIDRLVEWIVDPDTLRSIRDSLIGIYRV
jgi:hypothetical protein